MLKLITREEIFQRSPLADHYISDSQSEHRKGDIMIDPGNIVKAVDACDHLQPYHKKPPVLNDFAVIAYPAKDRKDYVTNCPVVLGRFYELLGVKKIYVMDELKYNLLKFPFGIQERRAAFKQLIEPNEYCEAFELSVYDLTTIFPLIFYSSRHSVPIIYLFSAESSLDIAMFLCDDGNFHTSFPSSERESINAVAEVTGLKIGDIQICNTYYTGLLH